MPEEEKKAGKTAKNRSQLLQKALQLPLQPGVYLMYNAAGEVIYVGKAKALKNRVCQYFREGSDHAPKVAKMVAAVARFEYIVCGSEFEALVLEASLIKQYQPKYNVLLRDDKGYRYVRVSPPPWRRLTAVKQLQNDGARYLGPYYSGAVVEQSVDMACKAFGLPTCTRRFPQEFGRGRPCLNHALGNCAGACTGRVSLAEHEEAVEQALAFLNGGYTETLRALQAQMEAASQAMAFEKAAVLRDRIRALQSMSEKQHFVAAGVPNQDVIAYAGTPEKGCVEVFHFVGGALSDRAHYWVEPAPEGEALAAFLVQKYEAGSAIPPVLNLSVLPPEAERLEALLSERAGRRVRLHRPQKGEQARLVSACQTNAEERLLNTAGRQSRTQSVLEELASLLSLPAPPARIEAYDISHTAGRQTAAGMVVFQNGRPARRDYRRFAIRTAAGGDDPAALCEALSRRLAEYEARRGEEGFGRLPDLILLDGGKTQLAAVAALLRQRGYALPVFGMVKDSRHHTRAIVGEGGEIEIRANRSVFSFVAAVQEEVHRYAITYHRQRSGKALFSSALQQAPGVGPKRAAALLKAFGSLSAVEAATREALAAVPGMTAASAASLYAALHGPVDCPPGEKIS